MTGRGRRLAISGLGRFGGGGGLARDSEHHHHVVHLGLGRASWQGAQGHYPHHFDGLSARPGAPVSRRSPRIRANRVPRAGFLGVGRASWSTRASTSRSAPDTSPSQLEAGRPSVEAGHDDQLEAGSTSWQALGRGRTRPPGRRRHSGMGSSGIGARRAGVGAIVGAPSRARRERLQGSSPPRNPPEGGTVRRSRRDRVPFRQGVISFLNGAAGEV